MKSQKSATDMTRYAYSGITLEGSTSGLVEARTKLEAQSALRAQGIDVHRLYRPKCYSEKKFWTYLRSFQILLDQQLSVSDTLELLKLQKIADFKSISEQLLGSLQDGLEFSQAINITFKNVPSNIISMIELGSKQSGLVRACKIIIENRNAKNQINQEINKALAYPLIILVTSLIVIVILFDTVLPEFKNLVAKEDNLPSITQIIMNLSGHGRSSVASLLWVSTLVTAALILIQKWRYAVLMVHWLTANLPILRNYTKQTSKFQFLENLSLGLSLDASVKEALKFSANAVSNLVHQKKLNEVEKNLMDGKSFSESLAESLLFNDLELAQINLAERSARLKTTINDIYILGSSHRKNTITTLSQLFGPVAIIFLGGLIFIVAFAVLTPIMSLQLSIGQ